MVLGVTGMPGAGKGVVARVATDLKIQVVRMGDVIREEASNRNEPPGVVAVKLRQEYGEFVVAQRCVEIIQDSWKRIHPTSLKVFAAPLKWKYFRKIFLASRS